MQKNDFLLLLLNLFLLFLVSFTGFDIYVLNVLLIPLYVTGEKSVLFGELFSFFVLNLEKGLEQHELVLCLHFYTHEVLFYQ